MTYFLGKLELIKPVIKPCLGISRYRDFDRWYQWPQQTSLSNHYL